ncbi:hypothetical protein KMZ32_01860 [Phycicoccus sp. MAQZ13P-2]|uniref:hypothetical protein n=1 Tax=Phycicoccus mangrovi TaxID=2840470 RepID=UPI001C002876|nr:hypothetical protein [Phycicoccus mangrovi]MBT9254438.1 hypothetical protein [Phycicoccus mangrovi]MBT9272816.1 hypothetical protein [Phycicoccus mangrovi]
MTSIPTTTGRAWVVWRVKALTDQRLLRLGQDAHGLFPYLLLMNDAGEGRVWSDAESVALLLPRSYTIESVQASLKELVARGLLELDADDSDFYIFPGWSKNQADRAGSTTRAKTSQASQLRRFHREGKHEVAPKPECQSCQEATVSSHAAQVEVTPEPQSTQPPVEVVEQPALVDELEVTVKVVKDRVWAVCDKLVATTTKDDVPIIEAYEVAYSGAQEAAAKYAAVKGIGEATLLNLVVTHAAQRLLTRDGNSLADGTVRALHGMRRAHGFDVIVRMTDPKVSEANNPIAYLMGCYRNGAAA